MPRPLATPSVYRFFARRGKQAGNLERPGLTARGRGFRNVLRILQTAWFPARREAETAGNVEIWS